VLSCRPPAPTYGAGIDCMMEEIMGFVIGILVVVVLVIVILELI
jgi:hypothetical protein